jgi:hypothetical protein
MDDGLKKPEYILPVSNRNGKRHLYVTVAQLHYFCTVPCNTSENSFGFPASNSKYNGNCFHFLNTTNFPYLLWRVSSPQAIQNNAVSICQMLYDWTKFVEVTSAKFCSFFLHFLRIVHMGFSGCQRPAEDIILIYWYDDQSTKSCSYSAVDKILFLFWSTNRLPSSIFLVNCFYVCSLCLILWWNCGVSYRAAAAPNRMAAAAFLFWSPIISLPGNFHLHSPTKF